MSFLRKQRRMVEVRFPDGELGSWACLGAVTDRSVRVWLREPSGAPQRARLEIGGERVAEVTLQPAAEHDWVAAADLLLDQPRPDARFVVRVGGMERGGWLAPAAGAPTAFSFGFGSCHQPFEAGLNGRLSTHPAAGIYPAMTELLEARQARFLALVGDQVYSDGVAPIHVREQMRRRNPQPSDEELRARYRWLYRGYFNQRGFRRLLEQQPSLMIWDDHDIYEGWGSLLDWNDLDTRVFRAAETAYREYQHLHNFGGRMDDQAPYHYCFWFGDVGFFVLDLRGVRSFREGRALGEPQWRDLSAFLDESAARSTPTVFILASIPVVHHAPTFARLFEGIHTKSGTDIRDRWSADPIAHERTRLLELLLDWEDGGPRRQVIVLSGDVHAGAAFRIGRPGHNGQVLQWTSSPLSTRPKLAEHLANELGTALVGLGEGGYRPKRLAMVRRNNFGLVEVRPLSGGGHQLKFSLHHYLADEHRVREAASIMAEPRQL